MSEGRLSDKWIAVLERFRIWLQGQGDAKDKDGSKPLDPLPDDLAPIYAIRVAARMYGERLVKAHEKIAAALADVEKIKQEADAELEALRGMYRSRVAALNERIVDLETQIYLLKAKG